MDATYTHFEDKPRYDEVAVLARSTCTQFPPASSIGSTSPTRGSTTSPANKRSSERRCRSARSRFRPASPARVRRRGRQAEGRCAVRVSARRRRAFLEVVPTSFKVKLFKCFLDAAVSEQGGPHDGHEGRHRQREQDHQEVLSMTYNRARQSQITGEIMEVLRRRRGASK